MSSVPESIRILERSHSSTRTRLITKNKSTHQRKINNINKNIISMGLRLKPVKCRSFSISTGKPEKVAFNLGDQLIPSIADEDQVYLGAKIFFSGKETEVLSHVQGKLQSKLDNLDQTSIRNEYKLAIYTRYLLPAQRFILTVHDLTLTSVKTLDVMCNQYIKKWAGLPRSCTTAILHLKSALNIPDIITLYEECHALSLTTIREKADDLVNSVIDVKIVRESKWSRKRSTIVTSEDQYQRALTNLPEMDTGRNKLEAAKRAVKKEVREKSQTEQVEHVRSLVKQGRLLTLIEEMEMDATWKSYIYQLPKGTMKFILNATTDTLPTRSNLKLWGKRGNDRCPRCGWTESLNHILSACKTSLDEGRYTYRHNSVLQCLYKHIDQGRFEVKCDLRGKGTSAGGTIPPEVLVTKEKPDMVVLSKEEKEITIIELTCPWETRIEKSRELKTEKYSSLVQDIEEKGYKVTFLPLEISVRGIISKDNKDTIQKIVKICDKGTTAKTINQDLSKLAVIASYYIFISRNETWKEEELIN